MGVKKKRYQEKAKTNEAQEKEVVRTFAEIKEDFRQVTAGDHRYEVFLEAECDETLEKAIVFKNRKPLRNLQITFYLGDYLLEARYLASLLNAGYITELEAYTLSPQNVMELVNVYNAQNSSN